MSVEWAHHDFRKGVPAMRNELLRVQACAGARGLLAACPPGAARPGGMTTPLVNSGVFAAAPPSMLRTVMAAAHQTPFENYQDKARISAAGGGVSGSPPAWDPV